VSYTMGYGMSMIEGCTIVGGMEGIATHVSESEIADNTISRTQMHAIAMTEMSMGMISHNEVRGAHGVGIYCNDRSMCMVERNTVVDTKPDSAGGDLSRRGFGVLASFGSAADLRDNELTANPVPMASVMNS